MFYKACRPLLFLLPPEMAHRVSLSTLGCCSRLAGLVPAIGKAGKEAYKCMGLTFPNRVGLAAGFDKDGECIDALGLLGFGFVEVGTVTPKAQPGNLAPRLFRDSAERAVVNRLGFPNRGIDALLKRLRKRRYGGICGVNIGKNYETPLHAAADDYLHCYEKLFPYVDYVAVNVSSPNTPDLRELQHTDHLSPILAELNELRGVLRESVGRDVPIVVKVAPDLDSGELDAIGSLADEDLFDGLIATNTTVWRPEDSSLREEQGGLSGQPLYRLAVRIVRGLRQRLPDGFPIVGVGGVMGPGDAVGLLDAGADLVQVYTGLVFEGPFLPRRIRKELESARSGRSDTPGNCT